MANRRHVMGVVARTLAAGLLVVSTLAACQKSELSGGPYEGRVRDKATGRPVADALVLVKWMGTTASMHSSSPVCYYHEVVKTDGEGRFRVPAWKVSTKVNGDPTWLPYIDPLNVQEYVFKPGYRDDFPRGLERDPMRIELEPFVGPVTERLSFLDTGGASGHCDAGAIMKELPWYEALAEEAVRLEEANKGQLSKWDRKVVDNLEFYRDKLRYGEKEARNRQAMRDQRWERESRK